MADHSIKCQRQPVQRMDWSDLEIGRQLGQGGFSTVHSVYFRPGSKVRVSTPSRRVFVSSLNACSQKLILSTHATQLEDFDDPDDEFDCASLYVAKTLSRFVKRGSIERQKLAIQDLRREVDLLSTLPFHPNSVSSVGVSKNFQTSLDSGFLLLEKVNETLEDALLRWKGEVRSMSIVMRCNVVQRKISQARRMELVALGIADAMGFLHSQKVIYRDLKPSNLGFDRYDRIQMFDFGLARRLESTDPMHLTYCGTPRYIAPEIVRREAYGLSADVYTFGIVVWEILSLIKPYNFRNNERKVLYRKINNQMLPLNGIASCRTRRLLRDCWKTQPNERPNFGTIQDQLSAEVTFCVSKQNLVKCKKPL